MSNNDNDLIADIILYTKQIVNSILLSEITDSYKLEQITNKIAFELASVIEEDEADNMYMFASILQQENNVFIVSLLVQIIANFLKNTKYLNIISEK